MSSREVLENKISYIRQHLQALNQFKNMAREDILKNATAKAAIERYLYLVAQACIDLSEIAHRPRLKSPGECH